MIRRHFAFFRLTLVAADAALACAVLLGASVLRFGPDEMLPREFARALPRPTLAIAAFIGMWIALLWLHGLYRGRTRWTARSEIVEILQATMSLIAITLSLLFLFKLTDVSRLLLVFVFPALFLSAVAVRVGMRFLFVFMRDRGRNLRYMLILGANRRARAFADLVEAHSEFGLTVIGHLRADEADDGVVLGRPVLGGIDSLENILHSRVVDEVAICLPLEKGDIIEQAARLCEQEGKVVRIPAAPVERVLAIGRLENIDGVSVYSLANGPDRVIGLIGKRILDVAGSLGLMVLLSPVFLAIAVAIKLDSRGSVFYRQERIGLHGRTFSMIKFRSMCPDADELLDRLRDMNEIKGQAFKVEPDPRVTRVGQFLRRTSLDELPQLWNVLIGQMSLVGPRPPLPYEVEHYDIWHRRRLSMKPGMTGLWQIGARRSDEFDRWVEKDLQYIDEWSFWLDIKIIARTVPAMLAGQGR